MVTRPFRVAIETNSMPSARAVEDNADMAVLRRHVAVEPSQQFLMRIHRLPQQRGCGFISTAEQLQPAVPELPASATSGHSKQ
jgi:hypothetical protein